VFLLVFKILSFASEEAEASGFNHFLNQVQISSLNNNISQTTEKTNNLFREWELKTESWVQQDSTRLVSTETTDQERKLAPPLVQTRMSAVPLIEIR
jgi:hypothetical protein